MLQRTLPRLKVKPPQLVDGFSLNLFAAGQFGSSNAATWGGPAFNPSPKVQQFANDMNITFPAALRLLAGQKFNDFPLRFSTCKRHTFSFYHLNYLAVYEHPLTDKMLHFYAQQKQRPLWCYVQSSSTTDSSNAVVRRSCERMVKAALFRALRAAGYDASGTQLGYAGKGLYGTIRVFIMEPKTVLRIDFDRLVEYLTKLVKGSASQIYRNYPKPK
ncbi:hypothetical protein VTI74DRAFT_8557 [Chaetomium olivicolor]